MLTVVDSWDKLVNAVLYAALLGGVLGGMVVLFAQGVANWFLSLPAVLDWRDRQYVLELNQRTLDNADLSPSGVERLRRRTVDRICTAVALIVLLVVLVMVLTGCGASVSGPPSLWSDREQSIHDQWVQRIKTGRW